MCPARRWRSPRATPAGRERRRTSPSSRPRRRERRVSALLAHALARAEDRLRALGYTGGQAFDLLLPALEERLGLSPPLPADARVRAAAAELPLERGSDLLGLAYERFFADLF